MKRITLDEVLNIINELENITVSEDQLDENLQNLGMDSISFIQIIVRLEETFDCEIPDSKLQMTEMDTVQKVFEVLQELKNN